MPSAPDNFDGWVAEIRGIVAARHPELSEMFDLFANEALFGYGWLRPSLSELSRDAHILEVGGGLTLISCQLARQGYQVTVVEPISDGFSSFAILQKLVLEHAESQSIAIRLLPCCIEDLNARNEFDTAFSINVMEHVANVDEALRRVILSLKPNGFYRFTCPNYAFPYEPHFNLPTLFSKAMTERALNRQIFGSARVEQPAAIWASLNWITVGDVKRICSTISGISVHFGKTMTPDSVERVTTDRAFARRRAPWMVRLAKFIIASRLHRLATLLPAGALPLIDCTIIYRPGQAS